MMSRAGFGLRELRAAVADADLCVPAVSKWSVGMHVHHCCLGMIGILESLAGSTPPPPRSRFSLAATFVFLTGRIPRGRGEAPDSVVPDQDVSHDTLMELLDKSERMLAATSELDPGTWFKHFAFGVLDRDKAVKLIGIHNNHHLRIMSDIVSAHRRSV
jgi:hypothetical protein